MSVTNKMTILDPTLQVKSEGEWASDTVRAKGFHSFNDAGIECEVGEFLYAMVRLLKPMNVLETGTHWGIGAAYLGQALKDNEEGHLDTIEFLPENHGRAKQRMQALDLEDFVTCHFTDARAFQPAPDVRYGMILLDTEPQTRFEELVRFYDYLVAGGFFFIHDLHRHMHQIVSEGHEFAWPFGKIPGAIKQWVQQDQLRPFHFSTPRGLTGFYKPSEKDYKWEK